MAQDYLVAYGVLPEKEAAALNLIVRARKGLAGSGLTSSTSSTSTTAVKKERKEKKGVYLDPTANADTGFGSSNRSEGLGSMVFD